MAICSICNKKLGLFSTKMKSDDGDIVCTSCFNSLDMPIDNENKKIIVDYISKYLQNNKDIMSTISLCCGEPITDAQSLNQMICETQENLSEIESLNKSGLSSYDIDEILDNKKTFEEALIFLDDLWKLHKLFGNKGIKTNFSEIMDIFSDIILDECNMKSDNLLLPYYQRICNRLGDDVTTENIIKELIKSPGFDGLEINLDLDFFAISKLLDKFNLKYEQNDLMQTILKIREEFEIEEFEQRLGKSKKFEIGDFTNLNGYQFEDYLKNLFECLEYTVLVTPLSGDQGADLIISKSNEKTVVQAKKYSGSVSNKAVQEIVAAKNHYKADRAIVVTNSSFTRSAIELALSNDVELWDGMKLKDTIETVDAKKGKSESKYSRVIEYTGDEDTKKVQVCCPFCEGNFDHTFDIKKIMADKTININCPLCGIDIKFISTF